MHLALPIRSVVPSLEGPVLAVLAGTTAPLSGRRVASLAGASHPAVTAALTRLTSAGLVRASHLPPAIVYVANRDHLAWPAIEALAQLRATALDLIRRTISGWEVRARTAIVFGSFARGDGDEDSDIDLLVVRPDWTDDEVDRRDQWEQQLGALGDVLERATGNRVHVVDEDLAKLRRRLEGGDPIVANWTADGIEVGGNVTWRTLLTQATDRPS